MKILFFWYTEYREQIPIFLARLEESWLPHGSNLHNAAWCRTDMYAFNMYTQDLVAQIALSPVQRASISILLIVD